MSNGTAIEFVCDRGYKLRGQSTRTCQANGIWSGIAPTCELIFCPRSESGNVVIIGNDYSFGSVLEYRCNEEYG
ncbi:hypothetical protein DPMN_082751 [Dreissena polymorpha]|uniref:Sushi domain-containing protein n=1 Tax=Dreissena polymorpha TaxID=45954 RepID=A0A9D3YB54_DREPO|nr:hypothetical protein DPMN_082751 [Dreissena polymorpha]